MKKSVRMLSLVFGAAMALSIVGCGSSVSIFSRPTVERPKTGRKDWNDVDSFTCYYGSLTGNAEETPIMGGESRRALDVLKEFDVAIIHSNQLANEAKAKEYVQELKDAGTYVISYISIGEDDALHVGDGLGENNYASYYLYENGMPRMNSNWGSYFVDAGNPVWQSVILDKAKSVLDYGVDGLFLDTLDTVDVAYDTIGGMVDLVRRLHEELPEGTKLVPNRGFSIFKYISQYVDGIMFESFTTTYDSNTGNYVDRTEADMEYNQSVACNVINRARRYDYMPVFCLDYVNDFEYSYVPQSIYNNVWQYDFIPYVTYSRNLDVCPNPNIKPTSERGCLALSKLTDDSASSSASNGDTSAENLAYAGNGLCTVTVDSTFQGYSGAKPLSDGFIGNKETHNQNNWATECWASSNDPKKDHWIQFTFDAPQEISQVNVHWAVDNGSVMSSREAYVEAWIDGAWKQVARYFWITDDGDYLVQQESSIFKFDTVTTDKIRIFQPKNMGGATSSLTDGSTTNFSGIMWVTEVEIYKNQK